MIKNFTIQIQRNNQQELQNLSLLPYSILNLAKLHFQFGHLDQAFQVTLFYQ